MPRCLKFWAKFLTAYRTSPPLRQMSEEIHGPKTHGGGRNGRPVYAVNRLRTSVGSGHTRG